MSEDIKFTDFQHCEVTDISLMRTYTQIASCAVGEKHAEQRRQSLRARLERERLEREREQLDNFFARSFRNLLKGF